jgi:hypothetical protein
MCVTSQYSAAHRYGSRTAARRVGINGSNGFESGQLILLEKPNSTITYEFSCIPTVGRRRPLHRDITSLIIGNHPGRAAQRNPAALPSTSIVFHYLRDSQRSHDGAIAPDATDCSFSLAAADPARVDSHLAPGTAMTRRAAARAHETGLTENTRVPWDAPQGTLVPCVTTPQLEARCRSAPPARLLEKR